MANQSTESGGGYGTVSDKQLVDIIYADKIKDGIIIDPENFITPDMGDYLRNNDYAKYLRDMGDGEKVNSDILNELFYLENPPTTEPGYNQNLGVFIVKSKPIIRGVDGSEKLQKDGQTAYDMNNYDGDTIGFTTEDIYDGDKPFTLGGITYASFKEYVKINTAYEGEFKVRSLGINTPEIPHYKVVPNYDNVLSQALDHKTGKELKGPLNGTYIYESREFSDDENISFLKLSEFNEEGYEDSGYQSTYHQILDMNYPNPSPSLYKDPKWSFMKIVLSNESKSAEDATRGLVAKETLSNLLVSSEEILLMLDASTINKAGSQLSDPYGDNYFNDPSNVINHPFRAIQHLWVLAYEQAGFVADREYRYAGFNGFGQDAYKRFLGTIFVKRDGLWINASKYVLANCEGIVPLPDYGGGPIEQANYNFVSEAFKLWTYDRNRYKIIDSYDNISKEDFDDRRKIQNEIMGADFDKELRDWTVMIGDSLFLVPPTSIRYISQTAVERQPLLRSRGSMVKTLPSSERLIQMTLFFNNENGINGVKRPMQLPNRTSVDYYFNGLRPLISMFKFTPFLPIENHYINDVLNIEAVSLVNLQISTTEGYPRLLSAVLTLQEFNYRVYMPEVPPPDPETQDLHTNLFAKTINFETMRWYYQRSLMKGDEVAKKNYTFGEQIDQEYLGLTFGNRTVLEPMKFQDSGIKFYVVDNQYLDQQLHIKLESMSRSLKTQPFISDAAKEWARKMGLVYNNLITLTNREDPLNDSVISGLCDDYIRDTRTYALATSPSGADKTKRDLINGEGYMTETRLCKILVDIDKNGNRKIVDMNDIAIFGTNIMQSFADQVYNRVYNVMAKSTQENIVNSMSMYESSSESNKLWKVSWNIKLKIERGNLTSDAELNNFLQLASQETQCKMEDLYDVNGNFVTVPITGYFTQLNNGLLVKDMGFKIDTVSSGFKFLQYCSKGLKEDSTFDPWEGSTSQNQQDYLTEQKQAIDQESLKSLKFNKYPTGDIRIKTISCVFGNTMTKMSLKAMDGYAPQYLGGQDTAIEITIETSDETAVGLLSHLPKMAAEYAKKYRFVLTCWPVRLESEITRMLGVHEVLIESVDTSTVPQQPGLHNIVLRMTAVDRTSRNKEALKKLNLSGDFPNWEIGKSYSQGTIATYDSKYYECTMQHISSAEFDASKWKFISAVVDVNNSIPDSLKNAGALAEHNYFDMNRLLAGAEVYPDLELPTIDELAKNGFKFIRYSNQTSNRTYPDPDFYFVYGWVMCNDIKRNTIIDFLKANNVANTKFEFADKYGSIVTLQPDSNGAYKVVSKNTVAERLAEEKQNFIKSVDAISIDSVLAEKAKNSGVVAAEKNAEKGIAAFAKMEIYDGWDISDKVKCIFREKKYDNVSADKNLYMAKIKEHADRVIALINTELANPIQFDFHGTADDVPPDWTSKDFINKMSTQNGQKDYLEDCINRFVDYFMKSDSGADNLGNKLYKALCIGDDLKGGFTDGLKNMLKAAAAAATGNKEYSDNGGNEWKGRIFRSADTYATGTIDLDGKRRPIPMCYVRMYSQGDNGTRLAVDIDDAKISGYKYGPFGITRYTTKELESIFKKPVADQSTATSFVDPYYGGYDSSIPHATDEELNKYKTAILTDPWISAKAFIRTALVFMKKMLEDGILFSLFDIISNISYETLTDDLIYMENIDKAESQPEIGGKGVSDLQDLYAERIKLEAEGNASTEEQIQQTVDEKNTDNEARDVIKESLKSQIALGNEIKRVVESTRLPIAIGKMFAPILISLMSGDKSIYSLMQERKYDTLNELTLSTQTVTSDALHNMSNMILFKKFIFAMIGYGMMNIGNIGVRGEYVSEVLENMANENVYLAAADNPSIYILHSFYDMIMNDKRGRMLRAFPTYYMMFIDEGREIGYWKLHDNFYNMSAISEIHVTKSRKIAADTANIVMTNMFKTYTTDDEDQKEIYSYSLVDAFNSIFSPRTYYMQEELRRLQALPVDKTRLKPGVRIHVRIGYGSDASDIPIAFNGVIAEISQGDSIELIAQGDGVELTNPIMSSQDAEDIKYEGDFVLGRLFENWLTRGASPKTILSSILMSKGSWLKKQIAYLTNGRFFNDNPYGIVHFGEPEFKDIFSNGEVVQNLYEATAKADFGESKFTTISSLYEMDDAPRLSTHVFGKSFWDIMHICASVSPDFMCSIIPFGLRSSIFYGAPRFYCAYDYEEVYKDNSKYIREKRKPFQQYHIYTSYSDIINNTITASERDVRTCAVGLYSSQGAFSTESIQRVGPMWVDFDIYPEKQKTMTVDTQLIAKGSALGDVIPFLNYLQNQLADEKGLIQGGNAIAWRMTASALKNSVKDMYTGELTVIGDPGVKPYDKTFINDIYENIDGTCEVEATVQSLTVETGYTTSIYPDCIATVDDKYERISNNMLSNIGGRAATAYAATLLTSWAFASNTRPLLSSMIGLFQKSGRVVDDTISTVAKFIGRDELDMNKGFFKGANNIAKALGLNSTSVDYEKFMSSMKGIERAYKTASSAKTVSDMASGYSDLAKMLKNSDPDKLISELNKAKANVKGAKLDQIDDTIKILTDYKSEINNTIKQFKIAADTEDITKYGDLLKKIGYEQNDIDKILRVMNGTVDSIDDISDFAKSATKIADTLEDLDDAKDYVESLTKIIDKSHDAAKIIGKVDDVAAIVKVLDAEKDLASAAKVAAKAATGTSFASIFLPMVLETAIVAVVTAFVYEFIERWMKNLQVLQIFPLKKNGYVLTAGLDGSKGIVVGSPTEDDPGMLQEWVTGLVEYKEGEWFGNILKALLVSDNMRDIASNWKKKNNIPTEDEIGNTGMETVIQNLLRQIGSDEMKLQNGYKSMLLTKRISTLTNKEDKDSLLAFNKYRITDRFDSQISSDMVPLMTSKKIQALMEAGWFFLEHSYTTYTIPYVLQGVRTEVPCKRDGEIIDIPFLRPDAYFLLVQLLDAVENTFIDHTDTQIAMNYGGGTWFDSHPIYIRSALRVGDSRWNSTGFGFRMQISGYSEFGTIIEKLQKDQEIVSNELKDPDSKFFEYRKVEGYDDAYDFMVYPPRVEIGGNSDE